MDTSKHDMGSNCGAVQAFCSLFKTSLFIAKNSHNIPTNVDEMRH